MVQKQGKNMDWQHLNWQHPNPFILEHTVLESDIDHLGHVNNKIYLQWMENVSWDHSSFVGIDTPLIKQLGKVMVIVRHEMNFNAACYLGDSLKIGSWVNAPSSPRKRTRFYQVIRESDGQTVFTGQTLWVCMDLETKKSTRMPSEFIEPYRYQYPTL